MRPHFTNPYLLPQQYEIISRACLYPEDGTLGKVENYESKLKMLHQLIRHTMPGSSDSPVLLSEEACNSTSEEKFRMHIHFMLINICCNFFYSVFRLISSSMKPTPISLHPPPPPPSVYVVIAQTITIYLFRYRTREPDAEDTHGQAVTRRQCSEAVAIDGSTILRESRIKEWRRLDKCIAISHAEIPTPAPPLLLITTKQQPRKTRPPVLATDLAYFPYNSAAINPRTQPNVKICPTLGADDTTKSSRRQRRKRLNVSKSDRPLPKFWRPDATWSGPCKGYAYGYPCTGMTQKSKYERDRMKTAIEMPY